MISRNRWLASAASLLAALAAAGSLARAQVAPVQLAQIAVPYPERAILYDALRRHADQEAQRRHQGTHLVKAAEV
jgi:hypothetical protein